MTKEDEIVGPFPYTAEGKYFVNEEECDLVHPPKLMVAVYYSPVDESILRFHSKHHEEEYFYCKARRRILPRTHKKERIEVQN